MAPLPSKTFLPEISESINQLFKGSSTCLLNFQNGI